MTERYVFDTEAIIAYLYNEPEKDVIAKYLMDVRNGTADGLLTETNAADVFYLVARFEGVDDKPTTDSIRTADRDVRALERWGYSLSLLTGAWLLR